MKHRLNINLIFSFVFILGFQSLNAQLELSTHFMRDLVQSSRSNPAFFVKDEINIALPSFYGGFFNDNFKASEVLTHEGNLFTLNMQELENSSESNGLHFQNNLHLETLAINYQKDNWRIDLNQSFRFIDEFKMTPETTSFLLKGNTPYLGQEIALEAQNDLLLYNELGLGFAYKWIPGINVGVRVKYLSGIANMQSEQSDLTIYTDPTDFSIESSGTHLINTAGLFENVGDESKGIKEFKLSESFFGESNGFGFDLGLDFDINENLVLSASIQNIGKINWKENTRQFKSNGNKRYESSIPSADGELGVNFNTLSDSLQQVLGFSNKEVAYSSNLPLSMYFSGLYKTPIGLNLGLLYAYESFSAHESHYASFHADKKIGKILRLGTQYSFKFDEHHAVGLNAILELKGVQVYFMSDNVLPIFDILDSKYYNLRLGINVKLNTKSKQNLDLLSQEEQNLEPVLSNKEPVKEAVDPKIQVDKDANKLAVKLKKEKKKELRANDKLAKARMKEIQKEEALRLKLEAELASAEKKKQVKEQVLKQETAIIEEQVSEVSIEVETKKLETVQEQQVQNDEAELLKRRMETEKLAREESQRKQRETEARLLEETRRAAEARRAAETRRQSQTTYTQQQTVVTPTPPVIKPTLGSKSLIDKTSLRQTADSKAKVLLRFAKGDVVSVLEKTNVYWWKVEFKGQVGWVKARLLK